MAVKSEISGFEIASINHVFLPAKAIKEFPNVTQIVVSSEKVSDPIVVRYCLKNFSIGNVTNVYGQPMIPFRTDNW